MKKPDICTYIRGLQHDRGLSLQDLSRMLGYSSATSLSRLMQASANRASLQQFADRVRSCDALQLTRAESTTLDDLIELRDIGEDFATMVSLRRLLRGEPVVTVPLYIFSPSGDCCSFLTHIASRRIRRMLLLNSEMHGIYNDLALLLEQRTFSLEHLIYGGTTPVHSVHCVRAILPLIHAPNYTCKSYVLKLDPDISSRGLATSDLMLYEHEMPDGRLESELIIFTTPSRGELLRSDVTIDEFRRLLPPADLFTPVLQRLSFTDLLGYNQHCAWHEKDRMTCTIKSDLCLTQLPRQILRRAIQDAASEDVLAILDALDSSFEQRQQRLLNAQRPQYHILRRGAMERFARTGMLRDHLWCCRPFTIAERIEILRFVRNEVMTRSNAHLCFLKQDDSLSCDEIVFYEGLGLSIIKPEKSSTLREGAEEVLVTFPDLLDVFKRFIFESTLRYRVDSEDDARRFFDQLIARCEEQL